MGGSCSACVEVGELDFENGCYHCGSLQHYARDCPDAPRPSVVCHQCGDNHLARHCPDRGVPERWQATVTTVDATWGGADGRHRCELCTAEWVRTRNHIPPLQ